MKRTKYSKTDKVISWWSGGVTSAVACMLSIKLFGLNNCRFVFIDTGNEDEDTYRFKTDCEKWYGREIELITGLGKQYKTIKDVWFKFKSLNVGHGAICSSELKREVREKWQKDQKYNYQIFGFDIDEGKRAKGLVSNYPKAKAIFPLLLYGLTKKECIQIIENAGLKIPKVYSEGFNNNNCFKTGCVQGGIGYWQKIQREYPEKFNTMAKVEHDLTDLKGNPVTMLKDQSNKAIKSGIQLLFLKPHPDYPMMKDISMMKGREPKPLFECNGFCGINDFIPRNKTEEEINFE